MNENINSENSRNRIGVWIENEAFLELKREVESLTQERTSNVEREIECLSLELEILKTELALQNRINSK